VLQVYVLYVLIHKIILKLLMDLVKFLVKEHYYNVLEVLILLIQHHGQHYNKVVLLVYLVML